MRHLMILEVSQKQAYIFASTRLRDNIANSEAICKVTDPGYFAQLAKEGVLAFDEGQNLVYSGGGHTVLEFDSREAAERFAYAVSKAVRQEFHDIELFIKVMPYDEAAGPGENLKNLSQELEKKKSVRQASFHQGTFGVERTDAALRKPAPRVVNRRDTDWNPPPEYVPDGYRPTSHLGSLGNRKDESSFIAVVHIDGNAMGKRVERLREKNKDKPWSDYKSVLGEFSKNVDADFKAAYQEMADEIAKAAEAGKLDSLSLSDHSFPVRRVILAGDDVCFVSEGRIGIEAARIFIEKLSKKTNRTDGQHYNACAGVALVHQKYPFYKAYEMAEMLCSSAKKYLASLQKEAKEPDADGCAIDWHIEYGEVMDSLSQTREMYDTNDGKRLELRPYLILADSRLKERGARTYGSFQKTMRRLVEDVNKGSISRGKLKELRQALKEGETAAQYYMKSNLIYDLSLLAHEGEEIDTGKMLQGTGIERNIFVETADKKQRSLLFDAIEIMDTFIALD